MVDDSQPELKPCPFCGGGNLDHNTYDIDGFASHVFCKDCDDMMGPMSEYKYDTEKEAEIDAASRWNNRK